MRHALPLLLLLLVSANAEALSNPVPPANPMAKGKQMSGPAKTDAATVGAWHENMKKWRDEYKQTVKYNGSAIYADPQLTWTQTSFMQPQMHPCEQRTTPLCNSSCSQRCLTKCFCRGVCRRFALRVLPGRFC